MSTGPARLLVEFRRSGEAPFDENAEDTVSILGVTREGADIERHLKARWSGKEHEAAIRSAVLGLERAGEAFFDEGHAYFAPSIPPADAPTLALFLEENDYGLEWCDEESVRSIPRSQWIAHCHTYIFDGSNPYCARHLRPTVYLIDGSAIRSPPTEGARLDASAFAPPAIDASARRESPPATIDASARRESPPATIDAIAV